jgi:hypothetical protein
LKLDRFQPVVRSLVEPHIEVGENIAVPEPKMGWTLLGPLGDQSTNYEIKLGLIGDAVSLEKTRNLIQRLNTAAYGKDKSFLHVDYPGLEKLRIKLVVRWVAEIDAESIKQQMENTVTLTKRVEIAARVIKEKINSLMDRDPQPEVLILAYPDVIDKYCIVGAIGHRSVPRRTPLEREIERRRAKHITLEHFMRIEAPERKFTPVDLRSLVKAACMEHNVPIQILRPYTTEPYNPEKPNREDDATTFWNLVVALFYKANHLPWRVRGLMEDSCYLGISFFRDRRDNANVKTALAQVFALDAEGFVFKGGKAQVDENNTPHISREQATSLLKHALEIYQRNKGRQPGRIVVHKTSRFDSNEVAGFKKAVQGACKLDLIAFGTRNIKLVRWGQHPPIRGTMVRLPDQSVLLYTFGYIPYLNVYPGPRVPSPLEILEHHGSTSIDTICGEIMALTKLNWNNAKFCTKSPITIGFARLVAEIIRQVPEDTKLAERFKFYM